MNWYGYGRKHMAQLKVHVSGGKRSIIFLLHYRLHSTGRKLKPYLTKIIHTCGILCYRRECLLLMKKQTGFDF
jgi:hypothetical protein